MSEQSKYETVVYQTARYWDEHGVEIPKDDPRHAAIQERIGKALARSMAVSEREP